MSQHWWTQELGDEGEAELSRRLAAAVETLVADGYRGSFVWPPTETLTERATIDWSAFPVRVATCLATSKANEILDLESASVGGGGRSLQEEYAEWRVVRSDRGIERIEFTTETSNYWRILAAYRPDRLIELVAEFAGEQEAEITELYGDLDPFAQGIDPAERGRAFAEQSLQGGTSAYNNGRRAICCMIQPSNSLEAFIALSARATIPLWIRDQVDGRPRSPTCVEAAPSLGDCAQLGRASDPLLVERLGRLAHEGRVITLGDPLGVYIQGVQHSRLRLPDGSPLPQEWFVFSRETSFQEGVPRYQRLTLEVPQSEGLCVSDLIDIANEQPISFGSQIADLVQIAAPFQVSGANDLDLQEPIEPALATEDPSDCAGLKHRVDELLATAARHA